MDLAIPYIYLALAAFITTLACTPLARRIAIRLDAVDYPSKRRINTSPIPRLGGLAVFAGLALACALQIVGTIAWGWPSALIPHPSMAIDYPLLAIAFLIIVATGAVDDVVQLSPRMKLAGQVLAALVAAASGLLIHAVVNPFGAGEIDLGWLSYPVTIVYLVAYSNIINLIDGLDGLATGVSAIAAGSMFSFAILAGRADAAALSIALIGACLAFLRYNFHPASIFLGDSGALMLGFALGTISLLNVSRVAALTSMIMPLIVAGVPILDTLSAIVRRKRAHISIGQADKGHIHHRLIQEGFDQKQAVLLIYAWTILLSLGAATINQVEVTWRVVIFLILLASSIAFALRLHLFEPVLLHHYNAADDEDELITPDDPAFAEEERSLHHGHHHHRTSH
ncbi:MAG: MraY family glycosyltransferase [Collinsella sp.]|nr:MraY family glycosyltransferase [Collinsella sp.]